MSEKFDSVGERATYLMQICGPDKSDAVLPKA